MIYDRTQTDVDLAKTLRAKLQSGQALTVGEIATLERGSCTVTMLNRIEAKQAELRDVLYNLGYTSDVVTKTWEQTDASAIFTYQDHQRILNNLDALKDAYYIYRTTPNTPTYMYGYKEANDIEKILVDIENMINDMVLRFRECGTFECGEVNTK